MASGIVMVLTRDLSLAAGSGRERTLSKIRGNLRSLGSVTEFNLRNVLEDPGFFRWAYIVRCAVWGMICGKPEPLQSLLFRDHRAFDHLVELIRREHPRAVYFDSVRSTYLAALVRRRFPAVRLVADFDDLMSRRYQELLRTGLNLGVGYLERYVPVWVRSRLLNGALRELVLRYEASALSGWERRVVSVVDAVTMVSVVEAEVFRSRLVAGERHKVHWVPPCQHVESGVKDFGLSVRFIFIGSDSLIQNKLTIDWLLEKWSRLKPDASLHVFGRMRYAYPPVDGVHFEGFIESLERVYTPDSVLLAPSFVAGGIKTKIIEASAAGVVAVGNIESFEGFGLQKCGLALEESEIEQFILSPKRYLGNLTERARELQAWMRSNLSEAAIRARWAAIIGTRFGSPTHVPEFE